MPFPFNISPNSHNHLLRYYSLHFIDEKTETQKYYKACSVLPAPTNSTNPSELFLPSSLDTIMCQSVLRPFFQ